MPSGTTSCPACAGAYCHRARRVDRHLVLDATAAERLPLAASPSTAPPPHTCACRGAKAKPSSWPRCGGVWLAQVASCTSWILASAWIFASVSADGARRAAASPSPAAVGDAPGGSRRCSPRRRRDGAPADDRGRRGFAAPSEPLGAELERKPQAHHPGVALAEEGPELAAPLPTAHQVRVARPPPRAARTTSMPRVAATFSALTKFTASPRKWVARPERRRLPARRGARRPRGRHGRLTLPHEGATSGQAARRGAGTARRAPRPGRASSPPGPRAGVGAASAMRVVSSGMRPAPRPSARRCARGDRRVGRGASRRRLVGEHVDGGAWVAGSRAASSAPSATPPRAVDESAPSFISASSRSPSGLCRR
jgi:hypothetical protein